MRVRTFALVLALALAPGLARAKQFGVATPEGRHIYGPDEQFGSVSNTANRDFVVEVAVGAGPEGNLGVLLGWLNQPIRGLEWYAGVGVEANPATQYTGAVRYLFNIEGYRPYVGVGYLYKDLTTLRTYTHNVFGEVGYSWKVHRTYHLTLGVGVRRILYLGIRDDSPLAGPDVDPALLDGERERMTRWVPTIALRFSRAF